ncbi:GNAT family N-acetyltransferase [Nodosilinea sp. PGN35]|uniref:GNAT family N-acetyltransferase n=1 Tax=Nodosilinea sp. PGN35 TaxID=3020489 RepID=UPI0023B26D38|nr:GNAT family N-acetyltransferase [Nodosilinea sp. TSF1-S3]MDF0364843.1 GNAT family N-acetyltransferase [Nodosilinea sp. TSF1-S3]
MGKTSWNLTLSTERLILRPQQPNAYEAWYVGFTGRLPSQHKYDEGFVNLEGCDSNWFAGLCQRHQQQAITDQSYIFAIFLQETGQHLGHVDLSTIRREENQWANLGYGIHNQYHRQGFGKEAVRAVLIAGFEELNYHRIEAAINLDNAPSIALAESIGMRKECIRCGFFYENEQWVDHLIYVAFPPDFGLNEKPPIETA